MCAHGLLLEVLEILHVHKLLELIHLIKLDPNGLLLELVLGFQDVLVEALGLQELLIAVFRLGAQLMLIIKNEGLYIVLDTQEVILVLSFVHDTLF